MVDGTPSDCVKLALEHILKDDPPDLIISGINRGPNLGGDILYSGTVSAAIEGSLYHIPSLAASLAGLANWILVTPPPLSEKTSATGRTGRRFHSQS